MTLTHLPAATLSASPLPSSHSAQIPLQDRALSFERRGGRRRREELYPNSSMDFHDSLIRVKRAGDEEELAAVLEELNFLLQSTIIPEEIAGGLVAALIDRLNSAEKENRLKIFSLLKILASENDFSKEKLVEMGSLSAIAPSLMTEAAESREAAALLSDLAGVAAASQRIGRIHGCVLMLVSLLNGEDHLASVYAGKTLELLSAHTQNVLLMAEAGFFKPMIQLLKRGSDMNKILMATAISRMELTEQKKAALGDSSIKPLTEIFVSGKLEAKLSALAAIKKLCSSPTNVDRLVAAGFTAPLLHLLYSVTSVLTTLQEPAAAILSLISQSRSILKSRSFVLRILSLLSTSNSTIKTHLLHALYHITSQPDSLKAKQTMEENGAVDLLLTLISEDQGLRLLAISILFNLSKDLDLSKDLEPHLSLLIKVVTESKDPEERSAAVGALKNIPKALTADLLPLLISLLKETSFSPLLENVVGVLEKFTVPSEMSLQRTAAELGAIPLLVKLLSEKKASSLSKSRAAICLAQLSQNSFRLSRSRDGGRWAACVASAETQCVVHGGKCSVRGSFCMEKAGAVAPLVALVRCGGETAALEALSTLLPEGRCEGGIRVLERSSAVEMLVEVVENGSSVGKEKALRMLERMFGSDEGVRERHGADVQALLVDLAREGNPTLKPLIVRILAHLRVLPLQPSYGR